MKILNTIQELWNYCLFCPICQDNTRTIHVSIGPDEAFQLISFNKSNPILYLRCIHSVKKNKYRANYRINCQDNSFIFKLSKPRPSENSVDKASSPYFYFYVQGDCKKCNMTYASSQDLELNFLSQEIENIGIEREGIYFLGKDSHYHVTMSYSDKEMLITRCHKNERGVIVEDTGKPFRHPIIDLDLSNPAKAINKIKTILIFS